VERDPTFGEYIVARLGELRYDAAFGVPGSYVMPLWQAFRERPRLVLATHEGAAAYMADGWARATGRPGVVITTIGPGQTNMLTGIAGAYKDSVPLLAISGHANVASYGRGAFMDAFPLDRGFLPSDLTRPITKAAFDVTSPRHAVFLFESALRLAVSGRPGPVHLSVPFEVLAAPLGPADRSVPRTELPTCRVALEPALVAALGRAARPLLLVGWGCWLAGAQEKVEALAERICAPVIATTKGMAAVRTSRYTVGHLEPAQSSSVAGFLEDYKPDLVLVLGASLATYYLGPIHGLLSQAQVWQVDIALGDAGPRVALAGGARAELGAWLSAALEALPQREHNPVALLVAEHRKKMRAVPAGGVLGLATGMAELLELLPEDTVLLPDAGNHYLEALYRYEPRRFGGLFTNTGLAGMGFAIAASVGIKLGMPDRQVVVVTGDASTLLAGNEVAIAAGLGLDNLYVIFNNASHGRVRTYQDQVCSADFVVSDMPEVRFDQWARALGADGYRAETLADLSAAVRAALGSGRTSVIEVMVDKDEVPSCLLR
jgi:acetolactate synthase-1/2/3 large subunit